MNLNFLWLISIIVLRPIIICCQLNLYDTENKLKLNSLNYDCLNYRIHSRKRVHQELYDIFDELIPYCFRPENNINKTSEIPIDSHFRNLSFEEIASMNVTSKQLLSWSVPIDVVENYEFYLNNPDYRFNEFFYNCTAPWFGMYCQYSFSLNFGSDLTRIVGVEFHSRKGYERSSNKVFEVACYVLLKCFSYGEPVCIDWREICDEKVDCFDNGADEESCFELEMNECSANEYRCHNGLCISQDFWENGQGDAECLDQSDSIRNPFDGEFCFQDPSFRCEEHSCKLNQLKYPCGDGQCVMRSDDCQNGRHELLIKSMIQKGNLSDECWLVMVCLTEIIQTVNNSLCDEFVTNDMKYDLLRKCESLFQFPVIPIYSTHIRFFYEYNQLIQRSSSFHIPKYVCFDSELCNFREFSIIGNNFTCLSDIYRMVPQEGNFGNTWFYILNMLEDAFTTCITSHDILAIMKTNSAHKSLYQCNNSSKLVSVHRILDSFINCIDGDDENFSDSCSLNDRYRWKCENEYECLSPVFDVSPSCPSDIINHSTREFASYCDRFLDITDEPIKCENFICNNIYSRCDGYWSCIDGQDEWGCTPTTCSFGTFECISSINLTRICLPSEKVDDGNEDCFGSTDEHICRVLYPTQKLSRRFKCSGEMKCLTTNSLCDGKMDCNNNDDEGEICQMQRFNCSADLIDNRNDVERILCSLSENENRKKRYFSIDTSSDYPSSGNRISNETFSILTLHYFPEENEEFDIKNNFWPWYCNRGLIVRNWIQENNFRDVCMCPPSYYGYVCQYQSQRVSLTLRLTADDKYSTYEIILMLINDDDRDNYINSYEQLAYIVERSCTMKINRYLLYSSRPKDISNHYYIRIDVYKKNELKYIGAWYYPINFLFLPVNRLGISINIPQSIQINSYDCSISCYYGRSMNYFNSKLCFCKCDPGWSGIGCDRKINCEMCSSDSICIESSNNQSICVCKPDRFGRRCLLKSKCQENICQNGGICVPADITIPHSTYTCICSDRYFGLNCQYTKIRLDVALTYIDTPRYIIAYVFTLSNTSDPSVSILLHKLTLFQRSITFYLYILYHLVLIEANNKIYVAVIQNNPRTDISTTITSNYECMHIKNLVNSTVLELFEYERIPHYYSLCRTNTHLICFIDETYFCLCTNERHANCMKFIRKTDFQCSDKTYCSNEIGCLQNHPTCPSSRICVCQNCFFGDQCQFYAKGLGSTLDEILGYEFKRDLDLFHQSITVKTSAVVTMLICLIGSINSILSILTFTRRETQNTGCGIYLLLSSITSLFTIICFTIKFWLVFLLNTSYHYQNENHYLYNMNCLFIEPMIKIFLYLDNWFKGFIAIERAISVSRGIKFNRKRSVLIAKSASLILLVILLFLLVPLALNLHVFYDKQEERSWCVITYVPWLQMYNTILIFLNYFIPLFLNMSSAIFIIIETARQRARISNDLNYFDHVKYKLKKFKHLLISPLIIVLLTLPHLIIFIILDCNKSSKLLWFYLIGYYLSFFPTSFVFCIFVLPSQSYKNEFRKLLSNIYRRFRILKFAALHK